jgi:hypothetical protein
MWWNYYVLVYENGEMRPVETIPEWVRGIKEDDGRWNSAMI